MELADNLRIVKTYDTMNIYEFYQNLEIKNSFDIGTLTKALEIYDVINIAPDDRH